jgi:hypothetical protein
MGLSLTQNITAVSANAPASFQGVGGSTPYTYSVLPGINTAGGTINSSSGFYTAPALAYTNPLTAYDTIVCTDYLGNQASARILVGTPLLLFCDIIQTQLNLPNGRVYIWNQKIFEPTDNDIFIVLSVASEKIISNSNDIVSTDTGVIQIQTVNSAALVDVDIKSRGGNAIDRKDEIIMSVYSVYAQQQMAANSFSILRNSHNWVDLSSLDGSAIPYRYRATFTLFSMTTKTTPVQYFSTFSPVQVNTN